MPRWGAEVCRWCLSVFVWRVSIRALISWRRCCISSIPDRLLISTYESQIGRHFRYGIYAATQLPMHRSGSFAERSRTARFVPPVIYHRHCGAESADSLVAPLFKHLAAEKMVRDDATLRNIFLIWVSFKMTLIVFCLAVRSVRSASCS